MIENKIIGITGHTTGIGAALTSLLNINNKIYGFSRSNGFDLTEKTTLKQVCQELDDCDIVINNAYSYDYKYLQTDILNDFIDKHIDCQQKLIVNIGSMAQYSSCTPQTRVNRYANSKVLLSDTIDRLKTSGHKCGVMLINPNWVDTPMLDNWKTRNPSRAQNILAMSPISLAEQIVHLINLYYQHNINVYCYEVKLMR